MEVNEDPAVLFCQPLKVNNLASDKKETIFSSSCHGALIELCSYVNWDREVPHSEKEKALLAKSFFKENT